MAQANVKTEQSHLLKPHSTTALPKVERFVVADIIKVGNTIGGYRVAFVGDNFFDHFGGLVEENVPAAEIKSWTLTEWSLDPPIIGALGGEAKAETHIARMVQVIELGKKGPGLFNGYANIHYKRSQKAKELWVPLWYLSGGELSFHASPASSPSEWSDDNRVFGG